MSEGLEGKNVAAFSDIKAECTVKVLRRGQVLDNKMKVIGGMIAEFAGAAARLDVSADRRHKGSPMALTVADINSHVKNFCQEKIFYACL